MPSEAYIKKYGNKKKSFVRTSEEIQKPIEENKNKIRIPPELVEKPKHPDNIKVTPIRRDASFLDLRSKQVWKFITTGK